MSTRLGLLVEAARVYAVALKGRRVVWLAAADYQGADDLAQVLASLAAERPRGVRDAAVALGADLARVKTLSSLPALTDADLAAHVRLHSRRYFLQNGIPLVTAARNAGRAGAPAALLAAAQAPLVDAITAGLEAAGLRIRSIRPAALLGAANVRLPQGAADPEAVTAACAAAQAGDAEVSLMPETWRRRAARAEQLALVRWSLLAASTMLLAGAAWTVSWRRAEGHDTAELARLTPAVEAALRARADLDATTDALALLTAAQMRRSGRARFLADLARALPDSSFLVQVRLDGDGAGSLSGYAVRSGAFLARLERSGLLADLTPEGAVTRDVVAGREWDRFTLRFSEPQPRRTER